MNRFVIVAGGPGAGKTTLLGHLAGRGYATAPEGARAIIRQQRLLKRDIPPELFLELDLSWNLRNHDWAATQEGLVFFDHAVPGTAGFYLMAGQPVPGFVEAAIAACAYRREVFIAPPWPEIYCHDEERTHPWEHAVRVWEIVVETYSRYGYDLIELPRVSVPERADFVLRTLGATHS